MDLNNLNNTQTATVREPMPADMPFMISKMAGDMNFVGIFFIIYGALSCLTIFGAIIGIPVIFMGIRVREAADEFKIFKASQGMETLYRAFERQQRFFFIQKVLIIIGLVIMVLSIFLIISLIAAGFSYMR
ncbi:MAG: DUF5362 domain-containing protein [Methanococcaceae archaeon]